MQPAKQSRIKTLEELDAQRKTELEEIKQKLRDLQIEDAKKKSRIQSLEKSTNTESEKALTKIKYQLEKERIMCS